MTQTLPIEICSGQLINTVPASLFVVPQGVAWTIRRAVFISLLTTPALLTVNKLLPSGASFTIINNYPISSLEEYVAPTLANLVLLSGESLQTFSSANGAFNTFISGFQTQ